MYREGQARTIKTRGITIITYTPVKGRTQVTQRLHRREETGRRRITTP